MDMDFTGGIDFSRLLNFPAKNSLMLRHNGLCIMCIDK